MDRFAAEYLRAALPSSTAGASLSEVKSWRGRVECEAPERSFGTGKGEDGEEEWAGALGEMHFGFWIVLNSFSSSI